MEIGSDLNKSLDMISISSTQFGYSEISFCFWILWKEASNSSRINILNTPEFSVWAEGSEGGIVIQLSGRRFLKVDLMFNQWTHLCFSLKRNFVVYINGKFHTKSHIHSQTKVTSIGSVLFFGELNTGHNSINNEIVKFEITEFYLMKRHLKQKDVGNFFPFNTGSRDYNYIITWYKIITHALKRNMKLSTIVL